MAKKDNNQDTKHKRHGFSGEGPDFDPNDSPQMPDGSPFPVGLLFFIVIMLLSGLGRSCAANNQTRFLGTLTVLIPIVIGSSTIAS